MRFENKGVIVTGATGGIGRETCFHFAKEGAAVAVTDLDINLAERVASEIKEKGGNALVCLSRTAVFEKRNGFT